MPINKSVSAWLILNDGKNKGKIALQKRAVNQSFAYTYQATWSGKGELNENESEALERECAEEMGNNFFEKFDFSGLKLFTKERIIYKGADWDRYNYVGVISEAILKLAKLHKGAFPEFTFVDANAIVYPLCAEKDVKNNIVLFDDQYKVLKKLFRYGNKRNNK